MNIEQIADLLGLEKAKVKGDELEACCPLHDDRHPSFSINTDTGLWFCQSRCGGGNLAQLVERVLGIKPKEARAWLKEQGVASGWRRGSGKRLDKATEKVEVAHRPKKPCPPYDNKVIPQWVLDRGFTTEIMKKYQCGLSRFYGALVIPVLQSRALIYRRNPGMDGPKYKFTEGFKAHGTFYGLHDVTLPNDGSLIIVEGPLDVLWLRQHGYPNSLAIMGGGTLGMEQRRILKEDLKPAMLVLAFDNDEAGASLTTKSVNGISKHIPCYAVRWDKVDFTVEDDDEISMIPDDVADLAPEKIAELLATAVLREKETPKKTS